MKKKSIIINVNSHKELKKLAEEHNKPIGKFTEEMILFFKKTGNDPSVINGKSASEMIKVIDRRIVSFFKTQERDLLHPMRLLIEENGTKNEALFKQLIEELNTIFSKLKKS